MPLPKERARKGKNPSSDRREGKANFSNPPRKKRIPFQLDEEGVDGDLSSNARGKGKGKLPLLQSKRSVLKIGDVRR